MLFQSETSSCYSNSSPKLFSGWANDNPIILGEDDQDGCGDEDFCEGVFINLEEYNRRKWENTMQFVESATAQRNPFPIRDTDITDVFVVITAFKPADVNFDNINALEDSEAAKAVGTEVLMGQAKAKKDVELVTSFGERDRFKMEGTPFKKYEYATGETRQACLPKVEDDKPQQNSDATDPTKCHKVLVFSRIWRHSNKDWYISGIGEAVPTARAQEFDAWRLEGKIFPKLGEVFKTHIKNRAKP